MKKFPPIHARDSGGMFSISNPEDGTPIKELFTLDDGLLLITELCTYRLQVADQIDPDRVNPKLPHNFQQKLFDHGTRSEILCRSLLQAKVLFRKEFLRIDVGKAMQLAFDGFGDLAATKDASQTFTAAEQTALQKAQALPRKDGSLTIPAVGNVRAHCKTFIQKADHCAVALLGIVRLFYPEMKNKGWDDFQKLVKMKYGENDQFFKVIEIVGPFLQLIRNARDCLEHANVKGVTTNDFVAQADGSIAPPSIEIKFRKSVQDRCTIAWFMDETTKALLDAFEIIMVHLCSKHAQPFAGLPLSIGHLSENYRQAWCVRFAYGTFFQDGQFVPCG